MGYWSTAVLLTCTLVSFLVNRGAWNPATLTLGIFSVCTFLASLHLYGLYDFNDRAYQIVLVGCLSLLAGVLVSKLLQRGSAGVATGRGNDPKVEESIVFGFLSALLVVAIVVILATRQSSFEVLATGGGFRGIRDSYLGYAGADAYAESTGALLGRLIVSPVLFAALPVFVFGLIEGERNRRFTLLFATAMALNLVTSGGRIIFLYGVVQIAILLAIRGRLRLRVRRGPAVILIVVLLIVVALVTVSRGNSIAFEAYTYLAIPLPLLAHWSSIVDAQAAQTNGSSFLYGFVTLAAGIGRVLGIPVGGSTASVVTQPQDTWVVLLPGRSFNAFVTMFYYFYADFRLIGVAVFSALNGFWIQATYDRARTGGGTRAKLFLLLVIQSVVMVFVRWEATDGAYVIAFVLLFLSVRRTKAQDLAKGRGPERLPSPSEMLRTTSTGAIARK